MKSFCSRAKVDSVGCSNIAFNDFAHKLHHMAVLIITASVVLEAKI